MGSYERLKRGLDILLSSLGLIILAPVFMAIALILVLSGSRVIFSQERVGQSGKIFKIYKFETMQADAHLTGPLVSRRDDPRSTRIGRLLRTSKLNELPQLLNVLKGDMSMVGPRPEVLKYVQTWPPEIKKKILSRQPGITGYATLLFREEDKLLETINDFEGVYINKILPKKLQIELSYIEHQGIGLDLRILVLTVLSLLKLYNPPVEVINGLECPPF